MSYPVIDPEIKGSIRIEYEGIPITVWMEGAEKANLLVHHPRPQMNGGIQTGRPGEMSFCSWPKGWEPDARDEEIIRTLTFVDRSGYLAELRAKPDLVARVWAAIDAANLATEAR